MRGKELQSAGEKSAIVDLKDVWLRYDEGWVLKSIYFQCFTGEILGIVGPNGGGKTTLLNVIMGLVQPEKGEVLLFGRKPAKRNRLEVGYLPQISHADRSFPVSVLDVVLMGFYSRLGLFVRPDKKSKEAALKLLEQVDMAEYAQRPFGVLSGGQQQRVNFARALASNPRLLVLDEPATGVDSVAQEDFYELLARVRDEEGISTIMVSHDIGVITSHADRVACLNRELHYHGEPDSCFSEDLQQKFYGKDFRVMVHDPKCVTCNRKHEQDD